MMSNPPSKSSEYIPVVSDLVVPGNPHLRRASNTTGNDNYLDALNSRIDELESAIGQDTMGSQSRAYAIREEANRGKIPPHRKIKGDKQKQVDKELS